MGLEKKFIKTPWLTLVMCVLCALVYVGTSKKRKQFENQKIRIYRETGFSQAQASFFQEHCLEDIGDTFLCQKGKVFLESRLLGKDLEGLKFSEFRKIALAYIKFIRVVRNDLVSLKQLPSYFDYLNKEKDFISRMSDLESVVISNNTKNLNFLNITLTIFLMGDAFQLLVGLFFLFTFGGYLELRLGAANTGVVFIASGATGVVLEYLNWMPPNHALVGGQASIAGILGAFYALYFSQSMRFLIWLGPLVKQFRLPISTWFPAVFMGQGVVSSLKPFLWNGQSIAFNAHFVSFGFGAFLGMVLFNVLPLPKYFLFNAEWNAWQRVRKKNLKFEEYSTAAGRLLQHNPNNLKIKLDVCRKAVKCLESNLVEHNVSLVFLQKNLNSLLEALIDVKQEKVGLRLLTKIPPQKAHSELFENLSPVVLKKYGTTAQKSFKSRLALTMLCSLIDRVPDHPDKDILLSQIDNLISIEIDEDLGFNLIQYLESKIKDIKLKSLIQQHIQFNRTKVIGSL